MSARLVVPGVRNERRVSTGFMSCCSDTPTLLVFVSSSPAPRKNVTSRTQEYVELYPENCPMPLRVRTKENVREISISGESSDLRCGIPSRETAAMCRQIQFVTDNNDDDDDDDKQRRRPTW